MMTDSVAPSEVQPPLNPPGPIGSTGGSSAGKNKYGPANCSAPEDAEKDPENIDADAADDADEDVPPSRLSPSAT